MNEIYHNSLSILEQICAAGFTAYFAGGAVRDQMLGRAPKDYDIATNALPHQIEELFEKTVAVGKAFGVIVVVRNHLETEVATFRKEEDYPDGRHPSGVQFCSAKEDANRRDFTINGMFYDPRTHQRLDFVGGMMDLKNRIIRSIGDPEKRFSEDHLRMLRAVRFAHTLGFNIDPVTREAILNHSADLKKISAERIENEFSRILTESLEPGDALCELVELGLMQYIMPEILPMIGQEQPPQFHPEGDVFEHTCLMLNLMNKKQVKMAASQNDEQARMPAPHKEQAEKLISPKGQTGRSAPPVEQASQPAHLFRPIEKNDTLHKTRRRLPHWEQDARIYFVTFRLADSIAQSKLKQWQEDLERWRKNQPDPNSKRTESKRPRLYHERQQEWLDQGHGGCILNNQEFSKMVEQTLLYFDGDRYRLGDYVIMPNHVHLILMPINQHRLSDIMHSWKSFSAQQINKQRGKKSALWMDESFDHMIRKESSLSKFQQYIRDNPKTAFLKKDCYRKGKGSLDIEQAKMAASQNDEQAGMPAPHMTHSLLPAKNLVRQASLPVLSKKENPTLKKCLAYTVLLHDIGKPDTVFQAEDRLRFHGHDKKSAEMAEIILRRLKLPNKEIKTICIAIAGHMRFKDVQKMNRSTLRKLIGASTFDLELELHRIDCIGSHGLLDNYDFLLAKVEQMQSEPILPEHWISGKDLLEIGLKPGPEIGKLLQKAYDVQLADRFSNRNELLTWLQTQL